MDSWVLTASEPPAGLLYLANGYLGTSVRWDGGLLFDSEASPCYIRGVYNGTGQDGIDRLADIPCWNLLRYDAPATVREYKRELDLRRGVLRTSFLLEEARGCLRLRHTLLLSRADQHQAVIRVAITPEFDGVITCYSSLAVRTGGEVGKLDAGSDGPGGANAPGRVLYLLSRSHTHGITIAQTARLEERNWHVADTTDVLGVARIYQTNGLAGQEITLTQLVRAATSLDASDPLSLARENAGKPATPARRPITWESGSFQAIEEEHRRCWNRLWETDIEIEGDPEIQKFARAGLFYLWSTMREGDHWSIAPMGLSSNGYNGHIFWDAEMWMYPSLLVTQPDMAHSCVAYRRHTLPAAQARAASNGRDGAQYPWEAGFTGEEMTPFWCETRDFQLHVTADVAIGQWWYYLNTGDRDWLREEGFPVIRGCAEYWASRVEYRPERDRYEISDVVCADEYAVHVDNDAFTNAAVRQTLLLAARAGEILGEPANPAGTGPLSAKWRSIAERMYIPYDEANRRHLEFDGYDGRVTKQADVELLAYPLEHTTDLEQVARDLDYYAAVIDPHGPAMSYSVYSIISAQLGRATTAYDYLKRSYLPNTRAPFFSFSETPNNNEFFFCTGVGGALQSFLFGFTGLRLREGYFALDPILPDHWRALRLRNLFVAGARLDIEVLPDSFAVRRRIGEGALGIKVDRTCGRFEVITEGEQTGELTCAISTGDGAELWKRAVDPGRPLPLWDKTHREVRLQLYNGGASVLDVAVSTRVASPAGS
jgi:trehalose/maltose hydrolase-like predicted phosphorylase